MTVSPYNFRSYEIERAPLGLFFIPWSQAAEPSSFERGRGIITPALYPAGLPSRTAPPLRFGERFRALRVDCCASSGMPKRGR